MEADLRVGRDLAPAVALGPELLDPVPIDHRRPNDAPLFPFVPSDALRAGRPERTRRRASGEPTGFYLAAANGSRARHLPRHRGVVAHEGAVGERDRARPREGADPPRLRRGDAAPVLPLQRLVHARPPCVHHPLPRRPLPRAPRPHPEHVPEPPGGAARHLRPPGRQGDGRPGAQDGLLHAPVPGRGPSPRARAARSSSTATRSAPPRRSTRCPPSPTASRKRPKRGRFDGPRARDLGLHGRDFSRLEAGEEVRVGDRVDPPRGRDGPPATGPVDRLLRRHRARGRRPSARRARDGPRARGDGRPGDREGGERVGPLLRPPGGRVRARRRGR